MQIFEVIVSQFKKHQTYADYNYVKIIICLSAKEQKINTKKKFPKNYGLFFKFFQKLNKLFEFKIILSGFLITFRSPDKASISLFHTFHSIFGPDN